MAEGEEECSAVSDSHKTSSALVLLLTRYQHRA